MPFNELQRRDSWPPTVFHILEDEADTIEAIDDNPFAYFLTSPEDDEDDLEDLSAGIEAGDEPKTRVRAISPSALQRVPLEDNEESFGMAIPLNLRDFTIAHMKTRESLAPQQPVAGPRIVIAVPEFTAPRGRATVRLTSTRRGRGRGQTRSLSATRPHSWREPSRGVWPIPEERESDDGEDSKAETKAASTDQQETRAETTVETGIKIVDKIVPLPKLKKRVHWAFPCCEHDSN